MSADEIKNCVREFLVEHIRKAREVSDDDNLFEMGLANSLFAMQLVNFVEKEYGLVIEDEDLSIDNFHSVNAIVALILRKTETSSTAVSA
jgi:methoxymalonate biosynthesis acyl carrier protein